MSEKSKITNKQAWFKGLTDFLKKNIAASNTVVVIALSRKMPRYVEYLMDTCPPEIVSQLRELLYNDRCIYTTEHAIPFIFKDRQENTKILVLDDIIVKGITLSNVCEEIYQLTGIEPEYQSLCQFDNFGGLNIGNPLEGYTPQIVSSIEEVREILSEISRCIKDSGLPIDLEFPILHTGSANSYQPIVERLKSKCSESRKYGNEWSFTVLQEDEINTMYNNDFAKIRIFKCQKDTRIVGYAPNVLSESSLRTKGLFKNEEYSGLWNTVLQNTAEPTFDPDDIILSDKDNREAKVNHRIYKSLAVVANYLFSLSMLIRHKHEFAIENTRFLLSPRDLQLLVGKKLAEILSPALMRFLDSGISSRSQRQIVDTPSFLTPYDYEEDEFRDYDMERFFAAFNADEISEIVLNVFKASYDMYDQNDAKHEKSEWTGGGNLYYLESFQSLLQLPTFGIDTEEFEREVNKEIDRLIDEGRVIPVYERTEETDGTFVGSVYWRRYFRASHLIYLDQE